VLVTNEEIQRLGLNYRTWLHGLQTQVRDGKSPAFRLKGPAVLPARMRKGLGTMTKDRAYFGDESFRIGDIVSIARQDFKGFQIKVTMIPADIKLVAEISSMTLSLAEAMSVFEGVEDWFAEAREEASKIKTAVQTFTPVRAEDNVERGVW